MKEELLGSREKFAWVVLEGWLPFVAACHLNGGLQTFLLHSALLTHSPANHWACPPLIVWQLGCHISLLVEIMKLPEHL